MATVQHPKHMSALIGNVVEVDRLSKIHSQITTKGPGRKHNVQVLHKSAIVLLVACWEAFIEDLAGTALQYMIDNSVDHTVFPEAVLERVAAACTGLKAWDLAGTGWKKELLGNMKGVLAKTTGALNTPKTAQVDELFSKVIGLPKISSAWKWKGRPAGQASASLDNLVALRGSIAHRVTTAKSVNLKDVRAARQLIFRLAVRSHNETRAFLKKQVGAYPWSHYSFGGTS